MDCSSCGRTAAEDAKFCSGCGARLGSSGEKTRVRLDEPAAPGTGFRQCPRCKKNNESGSDFCYSCGLPLDGGAGSSSQQIWTATGSDAHPANPAGFQRAGFWVRLCAAVIDGIVVAIAFGALSAMLGPQDPYSYGLEYEQSSADLFWFAFNLLYYSLGVSIWSTTIGKRLLGLYVLRSDGSKCSFLRAVGRWFSYILSALILLIGFFMIGLRKDKRGLHDLICDTVVVHRPSSRI